MADVRRQDGSGRARNRARARLNWFSQGQCWGRCKVRRRAERVIAPLAGVAVVAAPLLGQTVCLADGGVQVDGQRPVAGSGPSRPGPGQQLTADPIQLADVAPPETAQEGPQSLPSRKRGVDGTLTTQPMAPAVPPVRSTSASSMQSPPARPCPRESGGRMPPGSASWSPGFARPGASPRST